MTNEITMKEREKKVVTINCTTAPSGVVMDITAATELEWVAYDKGGNLKIRKTLGIMTITKGGSGPSGITSFSFILYPADTELPTTKSYGTPIVWNHEARVTFPATLFGAAEYVVITGEMIISPSLTGVSAA